ncbi:hypothetical protein SAMN02787144_1008206 [Streptomyces atratus]|uniref:Uncharacterized protein n=1 Tax=Streptomyces atratus TaxID=1893 RepID=A0A1K2BDV8_STRAR|nr:hypothetical protein SAMN02787144_1008206 [Streptomyces atratus]
MPFQVGDAAGVLGGLVDGTAVLGDVERREPVAEAVVELDEGLAQAVGNDGPAEVGLLVPLVSAAPSVRKADAEAPQRKPGGNDGTVISASTAVRGSAY